MVKKKENPISVEDILSKEERDFLAAHKGHSSTTTEQYKILEEDKNINNWLFQMSRVFSNIGGSYVFFLSIILFLTVWVGILNDKFFINIFPNLSSFPLFMFDPYPFRLLGLILTFSVIILSNFILISSKRLQNQDRDKLTLDLELALKSEIKYSFVDEKLDQIIKTQEELKQILSNLGMKN